MAGHLVDDFEVVGVRQRDRDGSTGGGVEGLFDDGAGGQAGQRVAVRGSPDRAGPPPLAVLTHQQRGRGGGEHAEERGGRGGVHEMFEGHRGGRRRCGGSDDAAHAEQAAWRIRGEAGRHERAPSIQEHRGGP
ncbi:hypothetical protein [Phytohabitans rumicis]|uniref:hypothetical protein n=1 Tax=Phytohabitans rumicis TaxID=1076125 RepID=UPI001563CD9D|nr:hypothetical protein [Phytohabitans rumicis]